MAFTPTLYLEPEDPAPLRPDGFKEGAIILNKPIIAIGRHPENDARLESIRISRRHCTAAPSEDGVFVRDQGSTNGIRFNGERMGEMLVPVGMTFHIGHFLYRVRALTEEQIAALSPESPRKSVCVRAPTAGDLPIQDRFVADLTSAVRETMNGLGHQNGPFKIIIQVLPKPGPEEGEPAAEVQPPGP